MKFSDSPTNSDQDSPQGNMSIKQGTRGLSCSDFETFDSGTESI